MGQLTPAALQRYVSQPAFTDPAVSSEATRLSVPQDVWRSLEIFPAFLTWSALLGSVILSFLAPTFVAYAILLFDVYWLMKSGLDVPRVSPSLPLPETGYRRRLAGADRTDRPQRRSV